MKNLLSMSDAKNEINAILEIASGLKSGEITEKPLTNKYIGMILKNHQQEQEYHLKLEFIN